MKQLILIDTSWVIHRMWYVHQDLSVTLHDGSVLKTGHVYGVCRLLKSLTAKYPHAQIVCCLDGAPTHGKELNPDYKADRVDGGSHSAFDDLGVIVECAVAFPRVAVAYHKSLEADEIMSYFVNHGRTDFDQIIVYSGDCDMLQLLVYNNVFIAKEFNSDGTLKLVDREAYYSDSKYTDKFMGVSLSALPAYRALVGDSSDNLSGFPRLRKKVAKEIAELYPTMGELEKGVQSNDPIFPKSFSDFIPKWYNNYLIMKLPTVEDLKARNTIPHTYFLVDEPKSDAQALYSLYRIRSASPVDTFVVDADLEAKCLEVRDSVNRCWRRPSKSRS